MKRSFIFLLFLSIVAVSCGTASHYAEGYRYRDGIYYTNDTPSENVDVVPNAAGVQFDDKIGVDYDEYGWSKATTSSSIVLVPVWGTFGPYWRWGYNPWYWDNWYWYNNWGWYSGWFWDDWYWGSPYYWGYAPWFYRYNIPPHHGWDRPSRRPSTYTPHAGVSMRNPRFSPRINPSSATRRPSSASSTIGGSTYRRSPSNTSGRRSPSYFDGVPSRGNTPSRGSGSSTYRRDSGSGSSFRGSGSNSGGSFRSPSGGGSSHSGGGVSRGRR